MPALRKRIKDLPFSQRPIEKLLTFGSANLTQAELLAIVLGTGSKKQNVLKLASDILKVTSLYDFNANIKNKLSKLPGIGKTKLSRLEALHELVHRFSTNLTTVKITSLEDVIIHTKEISAKKQEYLICLYLNARQELITKEVVAIGSLNLALIETRDIFRPAIQNPCSDIILIHNHPSGDPTPSLADIKLTQKLHKASKLLGINLQDHVIITPTNYFSFANHLSK